MVVPLQVNGGVRLRSHIMEQTKSRLLTVEATFFARGHGLAVLPKIHADSYSGPLGRVVLLRRPDGREKTAYAKLIKPLVTPSPPKEFYYLFALSAGDLSKDDVPIGTEIWQIRSDLQDEFWYAIQRRRNVRDVEALVRAGADVNDAGSTGWTPLLSAANDGNVALARLLLNSGADVNLADNCGYTPLLIAVDTSLDGAVPGHEPTELIRLLLDRGASVSAVDDEGDTPLDLAARYGPNKIVDLLRSWQEHIKS